MVHWLMPARRDLVIQIAIAINFALIVAYVLKKQEADSWSERVTPFIFKIGQESANRREESIWRGKCSQA